MKVLLRITAAVAVLVTIGVLSVPYGDALRAVPKEDRRAGLVSLNYYANLRFMLGRAGLAGDGLLKDLQRPAYDAVSGYDDIIGAQAYADYLFYVLPADGQESLDIRLAENRHVQAKAQALLAEYAAKTPDRAFIRTRQFEQVARSVKVLAAFKDTDAAQVEAAWLAAKDVQSQNLPEGLAAAYYWHVMDNAARVILKLAEKEVLCTHPFTPVYQEIRAAFRANGSRIAQLLVQEGKLEAGDVKPDMAIRSKAAEQADRFIQSDCAYQQGVMPQAD